MFRIALIGTISVVLLLAAVSIASARGVGPANGGGYGHTLNTTSQMGRMFTGDTTTTGGTTTPGSFTTMPGSSETMANHIARAADQMRIHTAQVEAATRMQPATGEEAGYGMQPGNMITGTGYMEPGNMEPTTDTGTMGSGTGSGAQTGIMGTGATGTSGSSMTGGSGGSMMRR
ncbi:MAG: hypothetical protein ACYC4D_03870 [Thermoleophilia bacterium]